MEIVLFFRILGSRGMTNGRDMWRQEIFQQGMEIIVLCFQRGMSWSVQVIKN